jgi:type 1 glutamine amidotransferase
MTNIVFLVGEGEYESDRTMRPVAEDMRTNLGANVAYCVPDVLEDMPHFPESSFGNLTALDDADLLVVYTRWRQLPDDEMRKIVAYVERGGHVIGLRTSSHAFHYPEGSEFAGWNDGFGRDVLGSPWISHHGHASSTDVTSATPAGHPILEGIPQAFHLRAWLYRTQLLEDCRPILWGTPVDPENKPTPSAVAWTREKQGQRVVYTNMGHPSDLRQTIVRTFLCNAARWCIDGPGHSDLTENSVTIKAE